MESFLIDLVARELTRSVTPTSSTLGNDRMNEARVAVVMRPGRIEARCWLLAARVGAAAMAMERMVGKREARATSYERGASSHELRAEDPENAKTNLPLSSHQLLKRFKIDH